MILRWGQAFVALLLAGNYFAFQVELFDTEYEANHPKQAETCSISSPTLNWESFDKNNAPQAFVFDARVAIECIFILPSLPVSTPRLEPPFRLVRDKSPPLQIVSFVI